MSTLSTVRHTTKSSLTRNLTQEQVSWRLSHGHPCTGEKLAMCKGPNGGVFYAVRPYSPGDYYCSTGNENSPAHEPWGYPVAPLRAKRPTVRKIRSR